MVRLTEFPQKASHVSILKEFYNKENLQNPTPLITTILIDDLVLPISSVVLSMWSEKFQHLRDDSGEVYLEGFVGHSAQVKDCFSMLHGHEVDISFENVQILLKFSLLFEIVSMAKLAEGWLKEHIERIGYNPFVRDENRGFVKIMKIGSEIEKFCPEYDFIHGICLKEFENNLCTYHWDMVEEFQNISKHFMKLSLRRRRTAKSFLRVLRNVPKSSGIADTILAVLDEFIADNNFVLYEVSTEVVSLLESFTELAESESSAGLTKKLLKSQTAFLKTKNTKVMMSCFIKDKPWRDIEKVDDLIEFRKSNAVIITSEFTYIEIILDWLKFEDNYVQKLEPHDKDTLLSSIHWYYLNATFMKHKENIFKKYDLPIDKYLSNIPSIESSSITKYGRWKYPIGLQGVNVTIGGMNYKKADCNIRTSKYCKTISITLEPNDTNNPCAQLQVKVNEIKSHHPIKDCPDPRFIKWCMDFSPTAESNEYVSSETSTVGELRGFVEENPGCVVLIGVIFSDSGIYK